MVYIQMVKNTKLNIITTNINKEISEIKKTSIELFNLYIGMFPYLFLVKDIDGL